MIFEIHPKQIFSENTYLAAGLMYKTVKGRKTKVGHLYKRPDVRNYQEKIEHELYSNYAQYIRDNESFFSNGKYKTRFHYFLKDTLNRRDLTNMKKLVEDSFTNVVKKVLKGLKSKYSFDDSHIYETHDRKFQMDKDSEKELIRIHIEWLTDQTY